jgi:hypothetical protein
VVAAAEIPAQQQVANRNKTDVNKMFLSPLKLILFANLLWYLKWQ